MADKVRERQTEKERYGDRKRKRRRKGRKIKRALTSDFDLHSRERTMDATLTQHSSP